MQSTRSRFKPLARILSYLFVLSCLTVAGTPKGVPSHTASWNQAHGNAENNAVAGFLRLARQLDVAWISNVTTITDPVAFNRKVYVVDENIGLVALDHQTGNTVWSFPVTASINYTSPACARDENGFALVYFSFNSELYCVRDLGQSCQTVWSVPLDGLAVSDLSLNGDRLALSISPPGTQGHRLVVLDSKDGSTIWEFVAPIGYPTHRGKNLINTAKGHYYSQNANGNGMRCFDSNGNELWRNAFISGRQSFTYDESTNTLLGIAGTLVSGRMVCVDAATGNILWDTTISANLYVRPAGTGQYGDTIPVVKGENVLVCSGKYNGEEPYIASFNKHTGQLNWKTDLPRDESINFTDLWFPYTLLVAGNNVVFCTAINNVFVTVDARTGEYLSRGSSDDPSSSRNTFVGAAADAQGVYWINDDFNVVKLENSDLHN